MIPLRTHGVALLLLMAGVGLAFFPVIGGVESFAGLDRYINPLWEAAAWGFASGSGDWPFWTPHIRGGYPLFANGEASLAYPLTWPLLSFLPVQRALDVFVLVHLVAAGFAMWLYLRELSLVRPIALLGALAFALSGQMIASTIWAHAIAASVPLPLILLGIERVGRDRLRGLLWIALGFALGGLAGRPQRLLPALVLAGGYALCVIVQRTRRAPGGLEAGAKDLVVVALGGLLGLGVAAVQLLPTASFVAMSQWGDGIPRELFELHSLRTAGWQGVWLPASPEHRIGSRFYPGLAVYAGLLLAAVGLLRRGPAGRDPRSLFLALAILGCLYVAFAGPGIHQLFSWIPGLQSLRAPVRFLFPAAFGAVVLAAMAGARWLEGRGPLAALVVVVLGGLELVLVARATAPLGPSELYRVRPTALALFESGSFEPDPTGAKPRFLATGFRLRERFFSEAEPGRAIQRLAALPPSYNLAMRFDLRNALGYGDPQFAWQEALMRQPRMALLDQLGTRLLILSEPTDDYEPIGRHGKWHVYRNPSALPRAVCTTQLDAAAGSAAAALRASSRGFDPHTMAILETAALPEIDAGSAGVCRIAHISETANRVTIEVESPARRLLVVFDAWAPGWSASIGSKQVELYRANGMFRALVVPAGLSRVVFAYRPPGLLAGAAFSVAATAILLGLAAASFWAPAFWPERRVR